MARNIFAKLLLLSVVAAVIIVAGTSLWRAKILAADIGGGDEKVLDLGGKKTITVIINGNNGKINVSRSIFSSCQADLTGFQNEAKIRGVVNFSPNLSAVEIAGPAGVHAENRQYFALDSNSCPKPLAFVKNGEVNYNIYSDEPNFEVQDFNRDGNIDIAAEYRNYELDPILDGTRDIYLFDSANARLVWDRTENFHFDQIDNNQ